MLIKMDAMRNMEIGRGRNEHSQAGLKSDIHASSLDGTSIFRAGTFN
jgi:hypothetical protein